MTHVNAQDVLKPPLAVKPPLVALALIGAGVGIHLALPAQFLPAPWIGLAAGLSAVALGIALVAVSSRTFHRADTDEAWAEPTSVIVSHGPYGRSRNPMYVGATVVFVGVALAVNTLWLFAALPLLVLYFRFGLILREERYLERRFGAEYLDYRSRVRRWI